MTSVSATWPSRRTARQCFVDQICLACEQGDPFILPVHPLKNAAPSQQVGGRARCPLPAYGVPLSLRNTTSITGTPTPAASFRRIRSTARPLAD